MSLSDAQIERYQRHILLQEIGGAGQARLLSAQVVMIGAGGIGCPAIAYLAAAGVGTIRVIDPDHVALSNLQRQILFGTADIGRPKGEAAHDAAVRLNPDCHLIPINMRLDADNADMLLRESDIVLDGCDSFSTRLIVSNAATRLRLPLVSAAVGRFDGQIGVWRGWEPGAPCYRCLVGSDPGEAGRDCASEGVLGALSGVIGTLGALEVIRALVPFGTPMTGRLLVADLMAQRYRTFTIPKDPACPVCAAQHSPA